MKNISFILFCICLLFIGYNIRFIQDKYFTEQHECLVNLPVDFTNIQPEIRPDYVIELTGQDSALVLTMESKIFHIPIDSIISTIEKDNL